MEAYKIHDLLVAEGERLELPKAYKNDLYYHDLYDLCKSKTQHFIWVLRTNGTHIIKLDSGSPEVSQLVKAINGMGDRDMHWYHFRIVTQNGDGRLEEITVGEAQTISAQY